MVIYGPTNAASDYDIGPIIIHDYYHTNYYTLIQNVVGNNVRITTVVLLYLTNIKSSHLPRCLPLRITHFCTAY